MITHQLIELIPPHEVNATSLSMKSTSFIHFRLMKVKLIQKSSHEEHQKHPEHSFHKLDFSAFPLNRPAIRHTPRHVGKVECSEKISQQQIHRVGKAFTNKNVFRALHLLKLPDTHAATAVISQHSMQSHH